MLVQMERQIDREIAADNKANGIVCGTQTEGNSSSISTGTEEDLFDSDSEDEDDPNGPMLMYGPQPQIVTNDLKSLDEMVSHDDKFSSFFFGIREKKHIYSTFDIDKFVFSLLSFTYNYID